MPWESWRAGRVWRTARVPHGRTCVIAPRSRRCAFRHLTNSTYCNFFSLRTGVGGKMNVRTRCSAHSCADSAVTVFADRELCLNHFGSRCYEDLERLESRGPNPGPRGDVAP